MDPLERDAVLLLHTIATHAALTNSITKDNAFLLKDCFSVASKCECYEAIDLNRVVSACKSWVDYRSPDDFYDVFVPSYAAGSHQETDPRMDTQTSDTCDGLFSEMEIDNQAKAWTREILGDEICDYLEEGN